jgi:hypothetical protein
MSIGNQDTHTTPKEAKVSMLGLGNYGITMTGYFVVICSDTQIGLPAHPPWVIIKEPQWSVPYILRSSGVYIKYAYEDEQPACFIIVQHSPDSIRVYRQEEKHVSGPECYTHIAILSGRLPRVCMIICCIRVYSCRSTLTGGYIDSN